MNIKLYPSSERGMTRTSWLESRHSFSFNNWRNSERMGFGKLRVFNDDSVKAGKGFGTHSHENMEIISIPLEGIIEHEDSIGNKEQIKTGEVQIMSAGTGVTHSEYNPSKTEALKFLQIWIEPEHEDVEPRYEQKHFDISSEQDRLKLLVSPDREDQTALTIDQDAYIYMGEFEKGKQETFRFKSSNHGAFVFVIEGECEIETEKLEKGDSIEISQIDYFEIKALSRLKLIIIETVL